MSSERAKVDANYKAGGAVGGYSSADAIGATDPTIIILRIDPTTGRLLVDSNAGGDLVSDGDAYDADTEGAVVFGSDGSNYYALAVDASGRLQVDATIVLTEDTDDDDITKGQELPLVINENYVFAKTADNWVRMQASDDGYLFTRPIGLYTPDGDSMVDDLSNSIQVTLVSDDTTPPYDIVVFGTDIYEEGLMRGIPPAAVRNDILATLVDTDNEFAPLQVNADGALYVAVSNAVTVDLGDNNDVTLAVLPDTAGGDLADIETNTDSLAVVGGGAEATALRVTLANDSTGVISIDDGGNVITVDGTVTANLGATDNAVLDDIAANQTDGTQISMLRDGAADIKATVLDYANSNPLAVRLTNADGDYVAAGAGTQYTDGDADATPTGTLAMGTDGSNVFGLLTDAAGHLQVDVLSGGGGGTLVADGDAVNGANTGVLILGTDGSNYQILATDASGNLQVDLVTAAVTNAGTFAVQVDGNALTALQLIDDAVYVDDADWSDGTSKHLLVGGLYESSPQTVTDGDVAPFLIDANGRLVVNVYSASGLEVIQATAADLNMTEANSGAIKTAVELIDNAISGAGFNITQFGGAAVPIGAGTEAAALRVTLATDSTGVVSIDDNGGAITVDGTVTANLSATDNGVLDDIAASLAILDDWDDSNYANVNMNIAGTDVVGGAGAVAAGVQRVTLASDDPAVVDLAAIEVLLGTIDTDTSGIITAAQLIDDAIYVDDADWTADTSKHNLVGGVTQATPTANTDGDTTPLITNALRELRVAAKESDLATASTSHVKKYYTNAGAVTDGIIWSPAAGKRWYCTLLTINVSAAATVTVEDDLAAGDSAVYKAELAANSGVVLPFGADAPMFSGEDAADLMITTSAGNVYVTAIGYEI